MLAQDPKQQFEELKSKLLSQISDTFPIQDRKGQVEVRVRDLSVRDTLGVDDIESQHKAKTRGQSWVAPVHGTLDVVDVKSGKVLSTREGVRIADAPKLTRHYSYIIGGQEKQVANQWRLKPGAYVKATEKEGEFEAQFQLAKGKSFDIRLDPESGYMHMAVGGRKVPLYSVLKQAGVSDEKMKKMWGGEAFQANLAKSKGNKDIRSLYKVSTGKDAPSDMPPDLMLRSVLESTKMDPEVTKATLGKSFERVDPEALSRASAKLMRVSSRREDPDAIDSLKFKELWTAADQFVDRVAKSKWSIHRRVQNALSRKKLRESLLRGDPKAIRDVVPTDAFRKPVTHVFATSLARDPDQTNPVDMLSGRSLVTITGPGGIQNPNAITYSNTAIDPSQLGFLDPVHTPESEPGKNLHLTVGTEIKDRKPTVQLFNVKTGKLEKVTPQKAATAVIALPDQVKWKKGRPVPLDKHVRVSDKKGEIRDVGFGDVQYVLPNSAQMFSVGSNLVPFMQNDSAHRSTMSARHMEQAISIDGREEPLVQVEAARGRTFEELIGSGFLAHRAPVDGKVVKVDKKAIHVRAKSGKIHKVQLYDHYPLNDPKAMLHSEPAVKVGQTIKKNQILADNNFTKKGKLALGTNLKTAYIANGTNHEDGIVISESAAKKLTSTHLHKPSMAVTDEHIIDKKKFVATKGVVYGKDQLEKVDDAGVVKKGTVLKPGDPMVLALGRKQDPSSIDAKKLRQLGNKARQPFTNAALTWDKEHEGEVVDVHRKGKEIVVHVKTKEPAVVGSKVSTRHSAKGIVADILPDKDMPHTVEKGKKVPVDMLINPVSVPGRMNPGQILETVAGKVAEKTGKPVKVKNFEAGADYLAGIRKELKKHGIKETEELYDPKTGRKLGDVTVGPHYAFQLKHQIDKKSSVRGGYGYIKQAGMSKVYYDNNEIPRGGGHTGAQSLGSLGIYGALAAGLRDNLREMQTHKSDAKQAEAVWGALNRGELLPPPQVPFVHDKFRALFQSMGVNTVKEGHQLRLMPMTDKETLALSRGEIKKPNMAVKAKNMKEEKGGLFDPDVTGGKGGQHWGHIKLSEPLPNPVFAKSVALLLGVKEKQIPEIISGEVKLPDGSTGAEAIHTALKKIDVKKEWAAQKERLNDPKLKKSDLDKAYNRFKALEMLKENKMKADKAYMMRHVPVLPPQYRPMSELPGGKLHIDPMNQLYRRLGMQNRAVKDGRKEGLPRESQRKDVAGIYQEMRNLFGTTPKSKKAMDIDHAGRETEKRPLRGVIHALAGEQPKDSFFQDKMVGKKQDFTSRATIVADPGLGIDEVGIPKKIAFELFRPMVASRISRTGKNLIDANAEVSKRSKLAEAMLRKELEERPVLIKRDPVLHQYGILGQKVKLTDSPAVKVSPMVLPPIGGDVDGDQVAIMVPLSREARDEVRKVMPSARPLSASSGDVMFTPTNESALALFRSTLKRGKKSFNFMDIKAAEQAFKDNKIELNSVVKIGKHETTLGRARIAKVVPEEFRGDILTQIDKPFDKKAMSGILSKVAREKPKHFEQVATGLTQLGFKMAYESGHTVTLKDLDPLRSIRGKILGAAQRKADKAKTEDERTQIWQEATGKIRTAYDQYYEKHPTNISDMAKGKIKAKPLQFQGLVAAPMLVQDHLGRPSKVPIKKSFAEGLDLGGYWLQSSGARRGVIQKVDAVKEPGYMTKLLVRAGIDQAVSDHDCGTGAGLMMDASNKDIIDRHLASSVKIKGKTLPAGTVVTPELVQQMGSSKVGKVPVRSPLKCQMPQGVCAKCMGLHPSGKHYDKGDAVGVIAAQALGERATQIMLRQTHGGGLMPLKKSITDDFKEVQSLFTMKQRTPENAAIAQKQGQVTRVVKMPQGGYQIYTSYSRKPLFSRQAPKASVKPGYKFRQGEQLTGGVANVHDLVESRGVDAVQQHMVDRIGKIYAGEGVLQRHVELAVRNGTGLHRIDDPGDHEHFVRGDYVMKPVLDAVNRKVLKGKRGIVAKPVLKSIITAPQYAQKDWMARLQTEDLGKHIITGAQHGQRADLHGAHPIPGLAYGKEFARGPKGRKGY